MKAHGLARIGRDVELRHTSGGETVANLVLAFTWGKKGADNKRPVQWVDASLWGKRAEALAQYLVKGCQIVAHLEDLHIETYEGRNGPGSKLVARVADLELVAGREPASAPAPAPRPAPRPAPAGSGFDDMDDDIPF